MHGYVVRKRSECFISGNEVGFRREFYERGGGASPLQDYFCLFNIPPRLLQRFSAEHDGNACFLAKSFNLFCGNSHVNIESRKISHTEQENPVLWFGIEYFVFLD